MFRDLYKQANEEIKGDRSIIDKAFLKAAQPEKKKSSIFRYSVVGTAVAAVLVMGAIFVNSDVFTEKTKQLPQSEIQMEKADEAANDEISPMLVNDVDAGEDAVIPENSVEQRDFAPVTVSGIETHGVNKGDDEQESVLVFSYMYDLSMYENIEQAEYKNTQVNPIESASDAIERAKNECTIEYGEAKAYYDPIESIWKVSFLPESVDGALMLGGCQDVYMNADGVTVFIVYGE